MLSLLLLCGALVTRAEEPLWKAEFERTILWQKLTDAGYLLLGTKEGLIALDPESGERAWELEQFKKMSDDYIEILSGTQFAAITYKGGILGSTMITSLVDVIDGRVLWNSGDLGFTLSFGQFYLPVREDY